MLNGRALCRSLSDATGSTGSLAAVPGSLPQHYAPRAKARMAKRTQIIETIATNRGRRIAVLALEVSVARVSQALCIVESAVAASYAQALYANLRTLDAAGADLILIETPPQTVAWAAVMDRLNRATAEDPEEAKKPKRGKAKAEDADDEADSLPELVPDFPWPRSKTTVRGGKAQSKGAVSPPKKSVQTKVASASAKPKANPTGPKTKIGRAHV